jgi:tetratricopeptide (TPR) repeat protein
MSTMDPCRPMARIRRIPFAAALLGLAVLTGPVPVGADGGGGGGDAPVSLPGRPENPDYTAAVKAIKGGDYPTAIRLLEGVVARDGAGADAYNWLAYAIRRNGDPTSSIPIYQKALALDPNHKGAHEYIGEAYLALDNLAKAKEHLARLKSICFFPCSEYQDLRKAVQAYESSGGKVKPTAGR